MRPDLRLRLREITKSLSTGEKGVTGVTGVTDQARQPLSHLTVTPFEPEKTQRKQRVTPVTPCHTSKMAGRVERHTSAGVTDRVTVGVTAPGADPQEWLAHYDERAAIREFEGGFARAKAERLALDDTLAALEPRPGRLH